MKKKIFHKLWIKKCKHLSSAQQSQLLKLLTQYESLFDGTLGEWKTRHVYLDLKEGVTPIHSRPFPVSFIHKDTLRKEVDRLEELGVIKWENQSEWASSAFIIPKPNGRVRFISDFWEVNKRLKRKPWPLPKISTIL